MSRLVVPVALLFVACHGGNQQQPMTDSGTDSGAPGSAGSSSTGSDGSSSSPQSPVIQSLIANPTTIDIDNLATTTTISAIVSDPQGIGDLAGGTLLDAATGTAYGAFSAAGQGTFEYTLRTQDVNAASPIGFGSGSDEPHALTAKFFDNEGNTVTQQLMLTFVCGNAADAACAGSCLTLDTVANCGGCGKQCVSNADQTYAYASCSSDSACSWVEHTTELQSCNTICAAHGAQCSASACSTVSVFGGIATYAMTPPVQLLCDATPSPTEGDVTDAFTGLECCCID